MGGPFPDLPALGWTDFFAAPFAALADASLDPARVSRVDRGGCDVLGPTGPGHVTLAGGVLAAAAQDPTAAPCVGDWVAVRTWPDERRTVEHVLARRTAFVRAAVAPGTSQRQILAANVDVAVVVEPLLPEPDLGRIERFLALAWDSGAVPVVVLTKADLVRDGADLCADVAAGAPGVAVHALSCLDPADVAAVRSLAGPGRTLALLGASGAGKSTLTNALAGAEVMATRSLRADGKGRHTTAHRELVVLPGGGLVIDTPGLRSVGLTPVEAGLDRVFGDVEELAAGCRFPDCAHDSEPGCAVQAAVDSGVLPARRLASWRKLQREVRWMGTRHDARLRAQERARWKRVHAEVRRSGRIRP